jgi:hypothetical protein
MWENLKKRPGFSQTDSIEKMRIWWEIVEFWEKDENEKVG